MSLIKNSIIIDTKKGVWWTDSKQVNLFHVNKKKLKDETQILGSLGGAMLNIPQDLRYKKLYQAALFTEMAGAFLSIQPSSAPAVIMGCMKVMKN